LARKLKNHGFVTTAQLARKLGVSGQAVGKAIRSGRLVAFDGRGERVSGDFRGRKWLNQASAVEDWHNRRQRYDDPAASDELLAARGRVADLQNQLLELRRAKAAGELISRSEAIASAQSLGAAIKRALSGIVGWSEALYAAQQEGGVAAVSAVLMAKNAELADSLANLIAAAGAEFGDEA
jgi:phage terminase Nu1 subunit (DNA packaging protein)